jgi:hypothetical protein
VVLQFQPSIRLMWAWRGWCVLVGAALLMGLGWPWWGRLLALTVLALLWRRGRDWLTYPGPAGRRLVWDRNGRWWLQDPGRGLRLLRLAALPHTLGPWIWFRFRGDSGTDLTLIDAGYAEPVGLCRLQQALKTDFHRLEIEVHDA